MTEVSRMKMQFYVLPPGGENGCVRRRDFPAAAESGRASGAGKNGAD